jgi:hypothetical protein
MALSPSVEWEVRTTGNDNNGGGFVSGASGTDFSQQDAAQGVLTVASTLTAANQVTVAGGDYTCIAGDVGNLLQITGGTATAGIYEITARAGQIWTLDRNAGAIGNTVVGNMGGALLSPAKTAPVNGNIVYIKAGTYTMSVNTNNVANGKWSKNTAILVVGYDTNRAWGNVDTKPILQATVTLTSMWDGSSNWVNNIEFDVNSQASTRCVNNGAFTRCNFKNANLANNMILATHCVATGNSATPFAGASSGYVYCEAHDNTATGFSCGNSTLIGCISESNSGATSDGFSVPSFSSAHFFNCIAYNNGRDGFRTTSGTIVSRMILQNCIADSNGAFGVNSAATRYSSIAVRCAFRNNTSGATTGSITEVDTLTPTGIPFTDAPNRDFSLNNTANQGALLRAAGYIEFDTNLFPAGLTASYLDIGMAQHQDTGGGGGGEHSAVF